mgnify:CR=1 FL=1
MTKFKRFKKFVLDIFYPNRCGLCKRVIKYDELICSRCLNDIKSTDSYCKNCGFLHCQCDNSIYYDRALSLGVYDGNLRGAVLSLKEEINNELIDYFAVHMSERIKKFNCDGIAFVPMTRERKRKSGFNQSYKLALGLSKELALPIYKNTLVKEKNYLHHDLSALERANAVKGAFIKKSSAGIKGKRIILVDDIMTTGATVNECSRLLKEMGASFVVVVCAAKTDDIFD